MSQKFYTIKRKYDQKDLILIDQKVPKQIDPEKPESDSFKTGTSLKSIIKNPSDLIFKTKYNNLTDYPASEFGFKVISQKMKNVFEKFIDNEVEFFEVEFEGNKKIDEKYFLMNFLNLQSAMDYDKSDFLQISNGEIIEIDKMVVDYTKLENQIAFRLKEVEHVLVINDELRQAIEEANITGIKFKELEKYKYPF
ncbi:DUF1629 domain-containing protein [uncultured Dokdonia sp.]|uniref:imm11 family protein n=1 Tax=uncultured Dokdonia sp. TaxID=575653 RepID=UPI00261C8BA7|nr:DUF1629 domain-containing protein [uncultured Dokdonia sp.]